jgi:hypothetical protein
VPWTLKREIYLILIGVIVLVLAIIILLRNRNIDTDLLAVIGLLGGLAIVIVSLPINGNGKEK